MASPCLLQKCNSVLKRKRKKYDCDFFEVISRPSDKSSLTHFLSHLVLILPIHFLKHHCSETVSTVRVIRLIILPYVHLFLGHPKSKRNFKLHNWFKTMPMSCGGSKLGEFCLVIKFLRRGSTINGATPFSFLVCLRQYCYSLAQPDRVCSSPPTHVCKLHVQGSGSLVKAGQSCKMSRTMRTGFV